jgi:DNA-binding HxlR family transcriptional regulator
MSSKYGQFCPISKAAEMLGERWTILIIRELLLGTTRFNDFHRALSQISPSLLAKRLNQLQDCELVVRKASPDQRRIDYYLTPAGRELEPIVMAMGEWGARWARGQMSDDELDVELLMYDLRRKMDETKLPGGQTVIHFSFKGLEKFPHWWIVVDSGEKELCLTHPGKPIDLTITTNLRTLTEIWAGDTEMRKARQDGSLQVQGSPILARSIAEWLRIGSFARIRPMDTAAQAVVR